VACLVENRGGGFVNAPNAAIVVGKVLLYSGRQSQLLSILIWERATLDRAGTSASVVVLYVFEGLGRVVHRRCLALRQERV
jgi:hypothetical protein